MACHKNKGFRKLPYVARIKKKKQNISPYPKKFQKFRRYG